MATLPSTGSAAGPSQAGPTEHLQVALELVQDSRLGLHTSATTYQLCDSNKSLSSFVSSSSKQGQQQYLELSEEMPLWLSHVIYS